MGSHNFISQLPGKIEMPTKAKAKAKDSDINQAQVKTRLLLALWDLNTTNNVKATKGQLTKRVVRKGQTVAAYQGIFDELEQEGAITIAKNEFSLSEKGEKMLGELLKQPEFKFGGSIVGTWAANALLRWIAKMDCAVNTPAAQAKTAEKAIASYDEFKQVALDVYDKLNRDYNLDDLVPIYRIRWEIDNRVSRDKFNKWMLEMQANDIFQLMGGEMPDITPDKREDSIETPVGGLRYYAKRLIS
jgi:tellurite resistance protein